MQKVIMQSLLLEWHDELDISIAKNSSLCIALFSTNRQLLYANDSMSVLFKGEPHLSLINPTFEKLLLLDNSHSIVFEGYLTLGDNLSINTSIWAQIFRKENKLLILGGVNAAQLIEQNESMHKLNGEINNLQRELIKEKHTLQTTLKQLNEANSELKKINIDKDRFISILAHDLKSPFTGILGLLELLLSNIHNYDIDKIEKQIQTISVSAKNTYGLLEDILMWTTSHLGKLPFKPQKLNFTAVCESVLVNLRLSANTKDIAINLFSVGDIIVFADIDMFKAVLRNLTANAIKFTNQGGRIDIYAQKNPSDVTITVSDNGIGIKPDDLNKLFDDSKVHSTVGTAKEKGTGLGLLLCKEFVERHGGKIWVDSEPDKGSQFSFMLPKKQ